MTRDNLKAFKKDHIDAFECFTLVTTHYASKAMANSFSEHTTLLD